MYKLCVYIPEKAAENVKHAMFEAGAGRIGLYDHCCWQVMGQGQFRPLEGSNPHVGEYNKTHVEAELKVELVVEDSCIAQVIQAMRDAHPYEEPAFQYWRVNPAL